MKVAIIGSRGYPSNYGGYETFVRELSERLVQKGVKVTVYCHKALFDIHPKNLNGIDLVYLPAIETKLLSQVTHSLLSLVHASFSDADLLFVVNSANGPYGWIPKLLGKPTVINVDGMEWLRPKWKGFPARYFYFAARASTWFYDVLVSDAEEMRKVYLEEFGRDSQVIAYGAPKPVLNQSCERIVRHGLQPREYYLIVGRLIPDNNAKLIAEGFLRSKSRRKLVIVGGVPYKDRYVEEIQALAANDDRLIVTGHVNDRLEIAELFENAYMYVHGHEYGGTNPTMIEALGFGCAILAMNTRFNQEMLQNGKFGVYFEKDRDSISQCIELWDIQGAKVEEMRKSAPKGVTEKYKWDTVTAQYEALFKEVSSPQTRK